MQQPLGLQQVLESLQQVQQLVFVLVSVFIFVSFLFYFSFTANESGDGSERVGLYFAVDDSPALLGLNQARVA